MLAISYIRQSPTVHFGTNHVSHTLLTSLLLHQCSDHHYIFGSLPKQSYETYLFAELKSELLNLGLWKRCALSESANIHFTKVLAERNPSIQCIALHAGAVETNIEAPFMQTHPWLAWPLRLIIALITVSVQKGVHSQLWAATSTDVQTGAYYSCLGTVRTDSTIDDMLAAERALEMDGGLISRSFLRVAGWPS